MGNRTAPRLSAVGLCFGVWLGLGACSVPDGVETAAVESTVEPTSPTTVASTATSATTTPATTMSTTVPTTLPTTTVATTTSLPWRIPSEQVAFLEELVQTVEQLRGRRFLHRPDLATFVDGDLADDRQAEVTAQAGFHRDFFELLGMLGPETDLVEYFMSETAALPSVFYDPDQETVFISEGVFPIDQINAVLLMGELTKALSHQHHPLLFEPLSPADPAEFDLRLAHQALLEGEAALVQALYLQALTQEARNGISVGEVDPEGAPGGIPGLLVEMSHFSRRAGESLAFDFYRQGGFPAIDQALDRPPLTTEQVLHPQSYRTGEPVVEVAPFGLVIPGYEVVDEGTWGELRLRGLLGHDGNEITAALAAQGWGGDRYQVLWRPLTGEVVFAIRLAADSFAEEAELNAALHDLIRTGMDVGESTVAGTSTEWDGADYAMVAWEVGAITWVAASDNAVGRQVAAQLGVAVV